MENLEAFNSACICWFDFLTVNENSIEPVHLASLSSKEYRGSILELVAKKQMENLEAFDSDRICWFDFFIAE